LIDSQVHKSFQSENKIPKPDYGVKVPNKHSQFLVVLEQSRLAEANEKETNSRIRLPHIQQAINNFFSHEPLGQGREQFAVNPVDQKSFTNPINPP
jgi:hypothetical protein